MVQSLLFVGWITCAVSAQSAHIHVQLVYAQKDHSPQKKNYMELWYYICRMIIQQSLLNADS